MSTVWRMKTGCIDEEETKQKPSGTIEAEKIEWN
jgi:hypothetical protein